FERSQNGIGPRERKRIGIRLGGIRAADEHHPLRVVFLCEIEGLSELAVLRLVIDGALSAIEIDDKRTEPAVVALRNGAARKRKHRKDAENHETQQAHDSPPGIAGEKNSTASGRRIWN